ncbi:hypothetical protein DRW03_34395 [Corallococcus sp. H22C18031201]|nr:hypothetical protein DRW03_34395 [Corallococcus sp. H22C18031201]
MPRDATSALGLQPRLTRGILLMGLLAAGSARAAPPPPEKVSFSGGVTAYVHASSTLKSKTPGRYAARNAFDGDPTTAWVEGARGPGDGESLAVTFTTPVRLYGFVLWPGYTKTQATFRDNVIPRQVLLRRVDDDEAGPHQRLATAQFHYRMKAIEGRHQPTRCIVATEAPINLSPRLVLIQQPADVQELKLEAQPLPEGMHHPRYADLALSEWTPLFHIVDVEHGNERIELPSPLTAPLRHVTEFLMQFRKGNGEPPAELPLAPTATLGSFFDMHPIGLPTWAQEALQHELNQQGAALAQAPALQFENAVSLKFFGAPVTVEALTTRGFRVIGEPYELRRTRSEPSIPEEKAVVFPILTLDESFRVMGWELKTSGLAGENCDQGLPPP